MQRRSHLRLRYFNPNRNAMKYQNLKFKEQIEKGIDPLNTPECRYRFKTRKKRLKSQIKVVKAVWRQNTFTREWLAGPFSKFFI